MVVVLNHMQDLTLLCFVLSDRAKDSTAHYPGCFRLCIRHSVYEKHRSLRYRSVFIKLQSDLRSLINSCMVNCLKIDAGLFGCVL